MATTALERTRFHGAVSAAGPVKIQAPLVLEGLAETQDPQLKRFVREFDGLVRADEYFASDLNGDR